MTRTLPKVTIVTPSYNQAQFLEETITSVLNQDYPNMEYIIIDGGSTDGSVDIIRKYKDQLTYWVSEPDRGQSHAINKGFMHSQGEIIAWLNSDDVYRYGSIKKAVKAFDARQDIIAVVGACALVNSERKVFSFKLPIKFNTKNLICGARVPGQPAVFLKRKIFEEIGGLREDLHYVLDWEYWLRISMQYSPDQIAYINGVLGEARIWFGNKSSFGLNEVDLKGTILNIVERCKVLDELFANQELFIELQQLKNKAYSKLYWVKAKCHFKSGKFSLAKRSLLTAYKLTPNKLNLTYQLILTLGIYIISRSLISIKKVFRAFNSLRENSGRL